MKRSKKPRVSWPPGPKLCQVKMFRKEDCPAKVASQPHRHSPSTRRSRGPDLPPGFEGNHYAVKPSVSNIPRIKWKRPLKIIVNDTWLVGDGGHSTERHTENLRIAKLSEAIYPHRSAIPSRPSVSPLVEAEHFDDSKTPAIRLTPIEDEHKSAEESSHSSLESSLKAFGQDQLNTKIPSSTEALVSALAPDLSVIASAALTALMKTKEQGSLVDPDLLIKFLSDPEMVKNLLSDTTGKSSETKKQSVDANINPSGLGLQHVTPSPMERKPQPVIIPQEQRFAVPKPFTSSEQRRVSPPPMASKPQPVIIPQEQQRFAVSKPFTSYEQRRVSPPRPGNGNISSLNPLNGNPSSIPVPVHSSVGIATKPSLPVRFPSSSLPVRFPSSSLPMNRNLQRPQFAFSEPKVIVKPQPHLQPYTGFRTSEMNNVHASIGFGRGPFDSYPMNLNQVNATSRPKPIVQPTKSADYFKNLIRVHGTDNHETNQYHPQTGNFTGRVDQIKVQKPCMYFGTARGCTLGDSCIYVHDRLRPNFETEAPMAKRVKFGRYEKNGL